MKLLIDISEEKYNMIRNKMYCGVYDAEVYEAIDSGVPLSTGRLVCDMPTYTADVAHLYDLDRRLYQLEQKIENMVCVGDTVEVESHLYGDMYSNKAVEIKNIIKR